MEGTIFGRLAGAAALALAPVALAACSSGLTAHATTPTTAAAPRGPTTGSPGPGAAGGGSSGSGNATFAFVLKGQAPATPPAHASRAHLSAKLRVLGSQRRVCWSFTHVTGVTHPTSAHINHIAAVTDVAAYTVAAVAVPLGVHYAASGCAPVIAGIATQMILAPYDYALVVDSDNYPNDALHALLNS